MPMREARPRLSSGKQPPHTPPKAGRASSPRAKSPALLPSPRASSPNPPPSAAGSSAKKRPPKAWWEYEEQLARLAYDLRAEAANAKALHTRDLGILLQQQLVLRGRVDELNHAFEQGETGGASGDRLASAVAATAQEATELQLHLLERGAASLRQEADAAKADADAARADAAAKASEIGRLHTQLASATRKLKRAEHDAHDAPRPPVPPQPPQPPSGVSAGGGGSGAGGAGGDDERRSLKEEIASQAGENTRLRERLADAESSAAEANRLMAESENARRKLKRKVCVCA